MRLLVLPFLALCTGLGAVRTGLPATQKETAEDGAELLRQALVGTGIELDPSRGLVSVPAEVLVRNDLLEYLLVGERGAAHESLFLTDVKPSLLNAALLALGVEAGTNARAVESDGEPARIVPPVAGEHSGLFLYVAWREAGEIYLFRVEDLLTNLETGRAMRRHAWVFLGSRFAAVREGQPPSFVADLEENLVNITFFYQGNTLLTGALEECVNQYIWAPNGWLIPPRGQEVRLLFARRRVTRLPPAWAEALPLVSREASK